MAMNLGKESGYPAVRKLNPSTSFITHGSISWAKQLTQKRKYVELKLIKPSESMKTRWEHLSLYNHSRTELRLES